MAAGTVVDATDLRLSARAAGVRCHPGYHARHWAQEQALPVDTVLHHHAHAAACLAENGWPLDGGDAIAPDVGQDRHGQEHAVGRGVSAGELPECEHLGGLPPWRCRAAISRAMQPRRNLLALHGVCS